ncbi:hypothetical protein LTS10_005885 [Elasticomyces elasticus]|nr:hypothetical protein LTS10_005885 [Elasticomyces elasticus]
MKDASPVQRRHAWNLCLALAFLTLLVRAIEKSPLNDEARQDQQTYNWTSATNVATYVMFAFTIPVCILMYEDDRRKTYDAPHESAWPPCLAQAITSLMACILLITGQTTICGPTTLNADIGGVGVLVGIYFPALLAMISLAIGNCHTQEAGSKEIGVVLLANLVYLTFNLLKATTDVSGLAFADAIIALLSIDATSAALSATMSNKYALAARTFVGLCAMAQALAGISMSVAVATLGHFWAEQHVTTCCSTHIWWATWTSCGYPGPSTWLYVLLSAITRGYDVAIAFHLAPKLDRSKKEAEGKKAKVVTDFEDMPSTCSSRYMHHIPALLVNVTSLITLLHRSSLKNSSRWNDWGQSATLITCVFGTCHWLYICAPLLKIVDDVANLTGRKSRWATCAQCWLGVSHARRWAANGVVFAAHAITPREGGHPAELTQEQLGSKLLPAAEQSDVIAVREALIQGAEIDWYDRRLRDLGSQTFPSTALTLAIEIITTARTGHGQIVAEVLSSLSSTPLLSTWDCGEYWNGRDLPDSTAKDRLDHTYMTPFAHVVKHKDLSIIGRLAPTRGVSRRPKYDDDRRYTDVATQAVNLNEPKILLRLFATEMLPLATGAARPMIFLRLINACHRTSTMKALFWIYRAKGWPMSLLSETLILHNVVKSKDVDMGFVEILCRIVDINRKNRNGLTPLHAACRSSHPPTVKVKVIEVLLENGAWPDCSDAQRSTPLHHICSKLTPKDRNVVMLLIEAGANINSRDIYGNTPLYHAAVDRITGGESHNAVAMLQSNGATALTYKQRQRLETIMFRKEYAFSSRKFVPQDDLLKLESPIITRRWSLSDVVSSSTWLARARNWLFRAWARLHSSKSGKMPWGFTSRCPWQFDDGNFSSQWLLIKKWEVAPPTLLGIYLGGLDCTPMRIDRCNLGLYMLRHLDKQFEPSKLSNFLCTAKESMRALDIACGTRDNNGLKSVDQPSMTRDLHALCLVRQPQSGKIIEVGRPWRWE